MLVTLKEFQLAQEAYDYSLTICAEIGDMRGISVVGSQMGKLAIARGDLETAVKLYQAVLQDCQQLQEPEDEALIWHQLGMVYETGENWVDAEQSYREAARIDEQQGNVAEVGKTYNRIAIINRSMNKPTEAEAWFLKSIESFRLIGNERNRNGLAVSYNLALLLASQPSRLSDAQRLATELLEINQTFDLAATEIWGIYNLLAKITTAKGETDSARNYRQLARTARSADTDIQYDLQRYEPFIAAVVATVEDKTLQEKLEPILRQRIEEGWGKLVVAIRRVLAGEREIEVLWDDLDADDSMIIAAILGRVSEL
jgi:tetratricopeptide (TPR) repeat protein